jgi:hypothetical protein
MRSRFCANQEYPLPKDASLGVSSTHSTLSTASLSSTSLDPSDSKWFQKRTIKPRSKAWYSVALIIAFDLFSSLILLKYEVVSGLGFEDRIFHTQQPHGQEESNRNQSNNLNLEALLANLITGTELAVNISQNLLSQASSSQVDTSYGLRGHGLSTVSYQKYSIPDSEWWIDLAAIERALSSNQGCLVYSFGIGEDDTYTNFMAQKGCQVFAFDPTQLHSMDWKPNVTFYNWGIRNSHNTHDIGWSHPKYGNLTGSLFSLPEIVEKLGHQDRAIAALKFDCEGCEYGAFQDIVIYEQASGRPFNSIGSLSTEFHFSTTLGMRTLEDVSNIQYTNTFLQSQDCRVIHYKPNRGFKKDRTVHPHLVKHGVVNGTCCYEYGFSCSGGSVARSS